MKKLEKEIIMDVQRNKSLVIASLGDMIADLLQKNDLARIKRHASILKRCKELATEYGLHLQPPILDRLKREKHLQSLQNVYHLIAGKVLRFLKITIEALSMEEKSIFIKFWKSFEYPKTWQKLPNPISHLDSFMISDCLYLAIVIPFILNRFLEPLHFKSSELSSFQQRTEVSRSNSAIKLWLKCW
ncbi:7834_t:CDS:2, partial [Racocetra persica]